MRGECEVSGISADLDHEANRFSPQRVTHFLSIYLHIELPIFCLSIHPRWGTPQGNKIALRLRLARSSGVAVESHVSGPLQKYVGVKDSSNDLCRAEQACERQYTLLGMPRAHEADTPLLVKENIAQASILLSAGLALSETLFELLR